MRNLFTFLARFFGLLPPVRWEDGVRIGDTLARERYALMVQRIATVHPELIQSPDFRLTVRVYDRWPKGYEYNWGKILPPDFIKGDTYGTLCLAKTKQTDTDVIDHECAHAITGISDHPSWLFGPDQFTMTV